MEQALSHRFSVMSLNLRFGLAEDGENSWRFRSKCFPELFKHHLTDFIAVQEANDFQIKFLSDILKDFDFIGQRLPAPKFWQNNVIFYHRSWRCLFPDHFFLSPTPDIPSRFTDSRWPRQCTMGLFERDHRRLIYVNTHFDFKPDVQVKSAKIILSRLKRQPADLPVVLTGDFNSEPQGSCHRTFTGANTDKNGNGPNFRDAFKKPSSGTHHGFSGKSNDKGHIDWILFRDGLTVVETEVIKTDFDGIYPSDHFPVRAVFDFGPRHADTP